MAKLKAKPTRKKAAKFVQVAKPNHTTVPSLTRTNEGLKNLCDLGVDSYNRVGDNKNVAVGEFPRGSELSVTDGRYFAVFLPSGIRLFSDGRKAAVCAAFDEAMKLREVRAVISYATAFDFSCNPWNPKK